MGSCVSKPKTADLPSSEKPYKRTAPSTKGGQRLGEGNASVSTKEAAARAAEQRYTKQQQDLEKSKQKLQAMAKVSKSEKGL